MTTVNLQQFMQEPLQGHTSKGNQPKWRLNGLWYKADHMGYESLSEVVVSRLLLKSSVAEYVSYEPVKVVYQGREYNACVSREFQNKGEILIPFERLHRAKAGQGLAEAISKMEITDKIRYTVDLVENETGLKNVGKYITTLLELDSFILNEDRHTNNLAVLRNEETGEYRLSPIFDNGLSLLSDLNDYPQSEDIYKCIPKVKAKPFDSHYDEQVFAAEELYGSQLKFTFKKNNLNTVFDGLNEYYSIELVQRVESIIREQMRKYPVYF